MHNVSFQPACKVMGYNPALVATDGQIIACIPVLEVEDQDSGGMLPVEALKAATKGKSDDNARLTANCDVKVTNGESTTTFKRPVEGEFPKLEGIIPSSNDCEFAFRFSASLIARLSKALGSDTLEFKVKTDDRNRVTGTTRVEVPDSAAFGAIFPVVGE